MKPERSQIRPIAGLDVVLYALRGAGLTPDRLELSHPDHCDAGYPGEWRGLPLVVSSGGRESCVILTLNGQAERIPLDLEKFAVWFGRHVPSAFNAPGAAKAR